MDTQRQSLTLDYDAANEALVVRFMVSSSAQDSANIQESNKSFYSDDDHDPNEEQQKQQSTSTGETDDFR